MLAIVCTHLIARRSPPPALQQGALVPSALRASNLDRCMGRGAFELPLQAAALLLLAAGCALAQQRTEVGPPVCHPDCPKFG